jgi:hypothetical protein
VKLSTILDHIDNGHMALPEFQRGYVWNREQVRGLMSSLYRGYPVGGFLVWATETDNASARGDGQLAPGVVKLLLDGQQRVTTLYGIIRGEPPKFFDGNASAFTGLRFHVLDEQFEFYAPTRMKEDPLWIDVTELMQHNIEPFIPRMTAHEQAKERFSEVITRLTRLHGVTDREFHIEEVTGVDKDVDVVVDIFNRVTREVPSSPRATSRSPGSVRLGQTPATSSGAGSASGRITATGSQWTGTCATSPQS